MRPLIATTPFQGLRRFRAALMFSLCAFFIITGCKKGNDGPAGPAGPAGPKGDVGSANVSYSDWVAPAVFIKDTVFEVWRFHYDIPAASVTQQILDSGSVLVYGKLLLYNTAIWPVNQVSLLPILLTYKEGSVMTDTWSALASPGVVRIMFINNLNYYSHMGGANAFRYVVVPGGVKLPSASTAPKKGETETNAVGAAQSTRSWATMSYSEVCQALQIPE